MREVNKHALETRLSGSLLKPYAAIKLVPITRENIYTLKSGDWIWDDKSITRRIHKRSLGNETVTEPIGFRQIHILDLDDFYRYRIGAKPFMLSQFDNGHDGYTWVYFEENRFYMCAKNE